MGSLPVAGRYHRLPHRLDDDYALDGTVLGTGCNGQVLGITSRRTGERFALKSFKIEDVSEGSRQELIGEAEVLLSMDHPHVVRLMEVYEGEHEVSFVMECMEGGELRDRLTTRGAFEEQAASVATRQMLLAVNYAHSEGIVHRDLKLENFMYDEDGSDFLKLIDFGFSRFFRNNERMDQSLGTVSYVAPEVIARSYTSCSCDLWSLGVIVFILLSGRMPFEGFDDAEIMRRARTGRYHMRNDQWKTISVSAQEFVRGLLVVDPKKRLTAKQALVHPWIADHHNENVCNPVITHQRSGDTISEAFISFSQASRFQQACMQMMAWSLTLKDRRLLRDFFLELDCSQTGVIRTRELKRLLSKELGVPKNDLALILRSMGALDVDNDGELHYSDFLAVMMATKLNGRVDLLQETFRRFDKSGCGFVTPMGMKQLFGDSVSEADVQRAFSDANADQDGRLDQEEFISYLRRHDVHGCAARRAETFRARFAVPSIGLRGRGLFERATLRRAGSRLSSKGGCFRADASEPVPRPPAGSGQEAEEVER